MTLGYFRAALVSSDDQLRETIHTLGREQGIGLTLAAEFAMPVAEFGLPQLRALQQAAPALVLLDMEGDAALALELARHLTGPEIALPVVALGPIPSTDLLLSLLRAGVAEFLTKPVTAEALQEALARIEPRLTSAAEAGTPGGKVVAVFSAKGGSGSSTVAANLAIELQRLSGRRTLLVDLDAELGEISLLLGMQPKFNFVDLLENFHRVDQGLLSSYIERHQSGVHLLSAPYTPDRAVGITEEQVRHALMYLRSAYDFVVVDVAKSFAPATVAAFEQADAALLISTVDLPSLRNIQRALPLLRRVMPHAEGAVRLVVNRYNADDEISLKDVERTLGLPVFATLSNDYEAVMASINSGKPVVLNGKSPYSRDVRTLAKRLIGADEKHGGDRQGLLGRMTDAFRAGKRPAAADKGGKRNG